MKQLIYIVGFIVLLVLANHFMKKVKDDPVDESSEKECNDIAEDNILQEENIIDSENESENE